MKKVLSLILALTFVVSLVPMSFAATVNDAGNTVYNYVFSAPAIGVAAGTSISLDVNNNADSMVSSVDGGVVDYDDIVASVSDKWDILALRSAERRTLQDKGIYFRTARNNAANPANNGLAIKVEVPETGKYIPTILFDGCNNGGIIQTYFISGETLAENKYQITSQYSIRDLISSNIFEVFGTIDTYSSGASDDRFTGPEIPLTGAARTLKAGDYYLIASVNNANATVTAGTSNYYYMNLKGVKLEKIAPAKVEIAAAATEVSIGGETTVTAKAFDAENNELPDEIVFSTADSDIAAVDAATGAVSAKAEGSATIVATVKGTDIKASLEIKVVKTEKYVLSSVARVKDITTDMSINAYEECDGVGYDTIDTTLTSKWDFVGARTLATGKLLKLGGMYYGSTAGDTKLGNNGICFKFHISEPGVYRPSLQYSEIHVGSNVNMYVFSKETVAEKKWDMVRSAGESQSINRIILDNTPFISINTYKANLNDQTFKTVLSVSSENTIELSAGDHYVILAHDGEKSDTALQGVPQQMWIQSFSMTKVGSYTPPEDALLSDAFDYTEEKFSSAPLSSAKVNVFSATLGESANTGSAVITSKTVTLGELCSVQAPEASEGYKFLYWAKGMSTDKKQIVSYEENYSFVPTVENTYLIAVYESTSGAAATENKAEFYNANGQLIKTLTEDGAAPALPEMAGYGNAEGWARYGSNEVIPGGAPVTVSGTKLYVAKYNEKLSFKVNGNDVAYGELVSFTAEPIKNELFKAWKKNGVVVSTDETYSFRVWEDCTVEAVYTKTEPNFTGKAMKIVIDTFQAGNKSAIMAEFIGIDDAVEKGIVFGNKRIAMTTGESQFTVINDENETDVKGYAIFKDGTIIYDK